MRVPAFITASWYDVILGHDLEHYARMKRDAATAEARDRTRLLIGPWSHGMFQNVVGELDFGRRAMGGSLDLGVDLGTIQVEWLRTQLCGDARGRRATRPALRAGRQPLARRGRLAAREGGARPSGTSGAEGGSRANRPPPTRATTRSSYDPLDPCPTRGGDLVKPPDFAPGPMDQTPILGRRDVLVYTSDVFDRDVEVIGPVTACLFGSTSGVSTDFVVKLCDVHHDGRTFNVCDGIVRTTDNGIGPWTVDLWATAIVFRAGSPHPRDRLVERLPALRTQSPIPARIPGRPRCSSPRSRRVFHDAARASCIVLPVIPVAS